MPRANYELEISSICELCPDDMPALRIGNSDCLRNDGKPLVDVCLPDCPVLLPIMLAHTSARRDVRRRGMSQAVCGPEV